MTQRHRDTRTHLWPLYLCDSVSQDRSDSTVKLLTN